MPVYCIVALTQKTVPPRHARCFRRDNWSHKVLSLIRQGVRQLPIEGYWLKKMLIQPCKNALGMRPDRREVFCVPLPSSLSGGDETFPFFLSHKPHMRPSLPPSPLILQATRDKHLLQVVAYALLAYESIHAGSHLLRIRIWCTE